VSNWKEIALEEIDKPSEALSIIGFLGLASGVALFAGAGLGAVALAMGITYTISRGNHATKQEEAISIHSCHAISLKDDRLQEYLQLVGAEAVAIELNWAIEHGYRLSDTADNWIEAHNSGKIYQFKQKSVTLAEYKLLPPAPSSQVPSASIPSQSEPDLSQFSLKSAPAPKHQNPAVTTTQSNTYVSKSETPFDILTAILDLKHLFLIGMSGGGKGFLLASILRALKACMDCSITVIDPKADDDEAGYFDGVADRVQRGRLKRMSKEDGLKFIKDGIAMFEEECDKWGKSKRCILVLDEGSQIGKFLTIAKDDEVRRKLCDLLFGGDSQGQHLFIVGQSPFCEDLGLNLGAASQMRKIILLRNEDIGQTGTWNMSKLMSGINFKDAMPQIKLSPIKPKGRAIYWSDTDTWYPLPALPNYSNYYRDTREYLRDPQQSLPLTTETTIQDTIVEPPSRRDTAEVPPSRRDTAEMPTLAVVEDTAEPPNHLGDDVADAVLEYFRQCVLKSPKKLTDIKGANRFKRMMVADEEMLSAIEQLVSEGKLKSPMQGFWVSPDWA
jgi:hypothetical protein